MHKISLYFTFHPWYTVPVEHRQSAGALLVWRKRCHHTPRGRRRVSSPAACSAQERTARRLGSPWAVFHAAGRWGPGFFCFVWGFRHSLQWGAWTETWVLDCRHRFLPPFLPGPVQVRAAAPSPVPRKRDHKAHDGFQHAFSPSPGACGRTLRARTLSEAPEGFAPVRFYFLF